MKTVPVEVLINKAADKAPRLKQDVVSDYVSWGSVKLFLDRRQRFVTLRNRIQINRQPVWPGHDS